MAPVKPTAKVAAAITHSLSVNPIRASGAAPAPQSSIIQVR
jgi:hypothetical protein